MKKKVTQKKNMKKTVQKIPTQKVKVRKLRYGRIILCLAIVILIVYLLSCFINFDIKNIYIHDNDILNDYEIIELANLEDYPSIFYDLSMNIEKKLEESIYIKKATVKKSFRRIDIYIEDNYPLLYNSNTNKTIFEDKSELNEIYATPVLVNYIPDTIMEEFTDKFLSLNREVIMRISEVKYDPNNVDSERFLLTMNDGNYVYLTLAYFDKMDSYVSIYLDIISKYGEKKGILYLDSGVYFKIVN